MDKNLESKMSVNSRLVALTASIPEENRAESEAAVTMRQPTTSIQIADAGRFVKAPDKKLDNFENI